MMLRNDIDIVAVPMNNNVWDVLPTAAELLEPIETVLRNAY